MLEDPRRGSVSRSCHARGDERAVAIAHRFGLGKSSIAADNISTCWSGNVLNWRELMPPDHACCCWTKWPPAFVLASRRLCRYRSLRRIRKHHGAHDRTRARRGVRPGEARRCSRPGQNHSGRHAAGGRGRSWSSKPIWVPDMPLLEIRELTAGYGDVDVLHGVSLSVGRRIPPGRCQRRRKDHIARAISAWFARTDTSAFSVQPLVDYRRTDRIARHRTCAGRPSALCRHDGPRKPFDWGARALPRQKIRAGLTRLGRCSPVWRHGDTSTREHCRAGSSGWRPSAGG